jgi:uracil-DNA glycosylase
VATGVTTKPLDEIVEAGWAQALAPVGDQIAAMGEFLRAEIAAGRRYLPAGQHILRAFGQPFADVRVLIVGQDPYPTPGHPIGLSFAVEREVRPIPRSLQNIYQELRDDLGITPPEHGDLTAWAEHGVLLLNRCLTVAPGVRPLPRSLVNIFTELQADIGVPPPTDGDLSPWSEQGVLLLNRVLTVAPGSPGSHRGKGWELVTEQAIRALVDRGGPLVAVLWGRDAQTLRPMLGDVPCVQSVHPSPLSASRGFLGSRPFSRVNQLLQRQGAEPVDWSLSPSS